MSFLYTEFLFNLFYETKSEVLVFFFCFNKFSEVDIYCMIFYNLNSIRHVLTLGEDVNIIPKRLYIPALIQVTSSHF